MRAYISLTLIATGLLTGCVPTEKQYDAAVRVVRGSESQRNGLLDECIRQVGFSDKKARHNAAVALNVADKDAPKAFCSRYTNAIVSGDITYQDTLDIKNHRYTPKLIKIFRGG
ncbi:hypothetical protein FHX08_000900 [Rhizobium sp. BK529]|uniref:hypothetical protein n=1 Tax=Rhizobium sp. BK529 TaxID=2586983 RepID=UPI001618613B|nr:hypothetical protein [Rhizobium sp. BK529]MBB3590556.1 hypothetical protein [Rhizobium sp. BK529]